MRVADVIVVGGGPAGSTCARRLTEQGVACLVLDQRAFPRSKPCAGWITPDVVRDVGLEPGEYPCGFSSYRTAVVSVRGFEVRLRNHQHAIRRVEFDDWLLRRSGAQVQQHAVKSIVRRDGGYDIDGTFACRYLVGAGGTHCPVYRTIFQADGPRARGALIAAMEDEFEWPHDDLTCRVWFWKGLRGYAWYVPKAAGCVNVGVGAWSESLTSTGDSLRAHWHRLTVELGREGLVRERTYAPVGHSYYLRQRLPAVRKDNAFIVGDAAGLATLDLGEGIGPAIRSGALAADAIVHGTPYSVDAIPRYSLGPVMGRVARAMYRLNARSHRASP